MEPPKKLLITCDSHGTNWGCIGYAELIRKSLEDKNWEVTTLAFPGLSLRKAAPSIIASLETKYDAVIIGLGNPDIHPRIPKKIIASLKKIGIRNIRDSYFSVPPFLSLSYFARLPLFILRLILIRFYKETYLSQNEIKRVLSKIIDVSLKKSKKTIIIPTFKINEKVYGTDHNTRSTDINNYLINNYTEHIVNPQKKANYNIDFFHFKQNFQDNLCCVILKKIHHAQN
ncbi:hypothetical protein A6723_028625 [Pseudomonas sp. AU11447]|uniref:hypothetical protein n=1 Tax=unclassified Pseudomonas TaxID=196821 RepID=UPI0007ECAD32|nr:MULTISPECIES: hypothetical protein [unclassified Pseudomonas]OBY92285.1 hypothetical protein A6723_028625 [Pseudomonas sp. AU11447]